MPEKPLSEGELIDAYRGVQRHDSIPDQVMPGHMHVEERPNGGRILVWHTHGGYTVSHRLKVVDAHPKGDPRRETLRTHDHKTLEQA